MSIGAGRPPQEVRDAGLSSLEGRPGHQGLSDTPRDPRGSDWQGVIALARDATTGMTDLVEAMHRQIARPLANRLGAAEVARTGGITGLVYGSVRGVTKLVGAGAGALAGAASALAPRRLGKAPSAEREAIIAALNGVLGDRLAEQANPLAITMAFRSRGRVLRRAPASRAAALGDVRPTLLVLMHGLCMNDRLWARGGHDHGAALARDLGYTPVYLHYNTGRHISTNGRDFAALMQALVDQWPVPLEDLSLLSHSMGGLVARSALQHGADAGMGWVQRLDRLAFLGTPHHGAPLERGGHGVDLLLGVSKFSAPLARLGQLRSAGITDLRHGNVQDADWAGRDRFATGAHSGDARQPLPLPASVACYAVAAHTGERAGDLRSRVLGDGLVPIASALGQHADPRFRLAFEPRRQWVAEGVNHLQLLGDARVYTQLRDWFAAPAH